MGLAQKIALTGGLSIGAILLVAFLATRTKILERVQTGLTNTGRALGLGIGGGIGGAITGAAQGATQQLQKGFDYYGTSFERFWNFLQGKDTLSGQSLHPELYDYCKKYPAECQNPNNQDVNRNNPYVPNLSDPSIVNPNNRNYSDISKYYGATTQQTLSNYARSLGFTGAATRNISKVSVSGSGVASVTRRVSKGSSAIGRSPAGRAAQAKSRARAAARKKGKACFNADTETGGVERIDYRYPYM